MIADLETFSNVLEVTIPNFLKLAFITYIVFVVIPPYIFPQKGINNFLDKLLINIIYMLGAILFIVPLLVFLHIFSFITLVLSFFFLKAALIYIFEKKNYFKILKASYPPIFIKILNKLDQFYFYLIHGSFKDYKNLISFKKIFSLKFIRIFFVICFLIYAVVDINLINFVSLSNKTPDVSQFIEWVAKLQQNILYADKKTGGADFYGLAIIVFFFQVLTNIDSVVLFSLYPTLLFLFMLLGIYYVVFKVTESHYPAIFSIVIFVLYCLSPLSKYLTGFVTTSANPHIVDFSGMKFYFSTVDIFKLKKELASINAAPYIRLNSGLAYEIGASFYLLNLYFLIMSFLKKENIYLILYAITLFLVFSFHGGAAFILVVASCLILLNAIIYQNINFKLVKKGLLAIIIPSILGNLWLFSWLKYGIPQDFGNAAPILDKIFSTTSNKKVIVKTGIEYVNYLVFYKEQLMIFALMTILFPINFISFKKEKSFKLSSISLSVIAVLIIFTGENFGFPRIVSQIRCADYLYIVAALSAGLYFHIFEKILRFPELLKMGFLIIFTFASIFLCPTYNETVHFLKYTNSIQYNSVALKLYQIKKTHEPFTYTIVGFVQSYPKVLGKGFHMNVATFLQKYNPYSPVLKIDTKYIYIIVETIPNSYKGLDEWFYRWRKDLEEQLTTWVKIYSQYHNNIKIYFGNNFVTIYEIDNREYVKKLDKEKAKKKFFKFQNDIK